MAITAPLRIGVLMGGMSLECEVSFNSGRTVCDHLDPARYKAIAIFQTPTGELYELPMRFLHRGKTTDFLHRLSREARALSWDDLPSIVDAIYIAFHGRYGEDGTVQGMLDLLHIPYVGSKVLASALGMDKVLQKTFLHMAGIEVPRAVALRPHETMSLQALAKAGITFPCVVKPHHEGSTCGVSVVHAPDQLMSAIERARFVNQRAQTVLVEEKISGMEFSCLVLTDKRGELFALPPTEIVPDGELYTYEEKYMPGRAHKYTPARCSADIIRKIQKTAVATMRALNFKTIGRIDGFVTHDGRVVIVDPNSMSGMAPSSYAFLQAAEVDMSHTDFINHIISTELGISELNASQGGVSAAPSLSSRIRVGVLLGGDSNEREISLESGRNVCYKLSPQKYEAIPLFVTERLELYQLDQRRLVRGRTSEIAHDLDPATRLLWHDLSKKVDFVFIGLHGGSGENGVVQGALELLKIPYNGSGVAASALCMDKYLTNRFLEQRGFSVPQGLLVTPDHIPDVAQLHAHAIVFPCIVKPHDDGCSVMVQQVHNYEDFMSALATIFAAGKKSALVEELIGGTELTVGVLGNDEPMALPASQAIAQGGVLSIQEKFLPGAGENQTPAPLTPEAAALVKKTIESVFVAVGCRGYARIDCFYQTAEQSPTGVARVIIIEINTLPGLTPATCIFHQAAEIGMRPMEFIDRIVELGCAASSITTSDVFVQADGVPAVHAKQEIFLKEERSS